MIEHYDELLSEQSPIEYLDKPRPDYWEYASKFKLGILDNLTGTKGGLRIKRIIKKACRNKGNLYFYDDKLFSCTKRPPKQRQLTKGSYLYVIPYKELENFVYNVKCECSVYPVIREPLFSRCPYDVLSYV